MSIVRENINFERGGDPLDNLRIGRIHDIDELTKKYLEVIDKIQFPRNGSDLQEKIKTELLAAIPSRFKLSNGWGNLDEIFEKLTREEYYIIDKIIMKYYNQLKE
jgi:hypothetical protein